MLVIDGVTVGYGQIVALHDASLTIDPARTTLLAGANGAGKSTLLRACSGLLTPRSGTIRFDGVSIAGLAPHRIAAGGLLHVPEGRRIWPTLSVREHLQLGGHLVSRPRRQVIEQRIAALFPRLVERWRQDAGRLSGGEQQMLAIARALAADPRLLMIDELSLGLAPLVVSQLFRALDQIRKDGVALLLVEQALHQALPHADYGYVLENGRVAVGGPPDTLRDSDIVRRAYLAV